MADKKQIKESAQDKMMQRLINSAYDADTKEERDEMEKQLRRIEKLFGYESGSWRFTA